MAAELERSAGRAQARGGMAAAAAFLQRAVELTGEPGPRAGRALAAAQASLQAGAFDAADGLLNIAAAGPLDELQQAHAGLLRGQVALASGGGSDAPALLVKAAKQLEPLDATLARQTYLEAWAAAMFAGQFAGAGSLFEVARASRSALPPTAAPRLSDLLLDGLAVLVTEGHAEAARLLRRAARIFAEDEITVEEGLRWGWLAAVAADIVWEEEYRHATVARQLQSVREAGLLVHLPIWVQGVAINEIGRGDFAAAASFGGWLPRWSSRSVGSGPSPVRSQGGRARRGLVPRPCLRQARRRASISRRMSGVKISCMASSIFPPGTTMMFGRDMNESCSIDSR